MMQIDATDCNVPCTDEAGCRLDGWALYLRFRAEINQSFGQLHTSSFSNESPLTINVATGSFI